MLNAWPKPFRYFRDVRVFLLSLSLIISLLLAVVFLLRYDSIRKLTVRSMRDQAASYAHQIVLTRRWNAGYGGVYVEKSRGVESNPFLRQVGVEPDIRTRDGRTFTLRNPAAMTRELSELTRADKGVQFHMASLRFLNPANRPDAFERRSLERFSRGTSEAWEIDRSGVPPVFRYMVPLVADESCMPCHGAQGYASGDIRGGISISIPTENMDREMRKNGIEVALVALVSLGSILGILYFMTWKLVKKLDDVQKELKQVAVTDDLTGLRNRRYIMEHLDREYQRAVRSGSPLSLIMLDIDHFKQVNDTYGHTIGDQVLQEVSRLVQTSLRSYDLLGRIGGEEFLIASPGSSLADAAALAERILERIRDQRMRTAGGILSVTVSAGVTSVRDQDAGAGTLYKRADDALYRAKMEGRDRFVSL